VVGVLVADYGGGGDAGGSGTDWGIVGMTFLHRIALEN